MNDQIQEPISKQQNENNLSPTPDIGKKNVRLKRIGVGALAIFATIGITLAVWFGIFKYYSQNSYQTNNQTTQTTTTPTPTPSFTDLNVWNLSLSKDEVKISSNLVENNIIYAVKNEYRSTVYKRNLQNGTQTIILEFDENTKADKSGNFWSGLPPNIALSPDKKSLAFIDNEGLKVFDLQTQTTKTYIQKVAKGECEDCPPKWSESSMTNTYNLFWPLWSFDGKYISFLQSYYEGSGLGIIDSESGAYIALNVSGGRNFNWSPVTRSYIKASSEGYEGTGLHVSKQSNIAEVDNLAPKLGKREDTLFLDAYFSPDGRKIVFTFEEPYETRHLAIANTDGTKFTVLAEKTDARTPFFSSDGNSVLYFQQINDKQVLVKYDIINNRSSNLIILPAEFNRWDKAYWTKDGFLTFVGVSSISVGVFGGDSTRLLMLDLPNKKVVYASPVFNQFTNFIGLSN